MDDDTFEIFVAQVCEKFGWTYQDFCEAPQWLIETHAIMSKLDAEKAREKK